MTLLQENDPMDETRKSHLSRVMRIKWKRARKWAPLLGVTEQEVINNMELCNKYSKSLNSGPSPHNIHEILTLGNWNKLYNSSVYDRQFINNKQQVEKVIKDHNAKIDSQRELADKPVEYMEEQETRHEEDMIRFQKQKALACGYKFDEEEYLREHNKESKVKSDPKIKDEDPLQNLKLMLWVINKIGSLEKAKKIFQAAELAYEAAK